MIMLSRVPARLCSAWIHLSKQQPTSVPLSTTRRHFGRLSEYGIEPRSPLQQRLARDAVVRKVKRGCKGVITASFVCLILYANLFAAPQGVEHGNTDDQERHQIHAIVNGLIKCREVVISMRSINLSRADLAITHYCSLLGAMYGEALPASDWGAFQAALFKHLEFHPDDLRAFHSVTRSACLEVHAAIRRIDDATEVTTPLLQETLEQISKSFNDSLLALHEKIMQGVWGPSPYDAHQANAGKEAGAQSGQLYEPVENR